MNNDLKMTVKLDQKEGKHSIQMKKQKIYVMPSMLRKLDIPTAI